jgi:hypothetical protein
LVDKITVYYDADSEQAQVGRRVQTVNQIDAAEALSEA